jgi:hypothetical protein
MKTTILLLTTLVLASSAFGQYGYVVGADQRTFGISIKAGPAFPEGEFADLFSTGYTAFLEVPYTIAKGVSIYAGAGISHFSADNEKLSNTLKAEGQNLTTNIDAPYWVLPLVLGINVSYRYEHIWPYFTFSGGVYFQRLETSGSYASNGTVTTLTPKTQNWSQGAYAVGLGTYIPIGNRGWAFDLNAKFNSVIDNEGKVIIVPPSGDNVTTRAIHYVSILGGVSYTFK